MNIAFVVDTVEYSGNFERELCAYVTGIPYDYYHDASEKIAEETRESLPPEVWQYFENHIISVPDDEGRMMPMHIYPTPGWFNHGMGGHFRDGEEKEAFEDYKQAVEKYQKEHKDSTLKAGSELQKCPAYQSVAIYFCEEPPAHILEVLKTRSAHYLAREHREAFWDRKSPVSPIECLGFRLVREQKQVEETRL